MPVVFGGYFFYGDDTKENILLSLPAGPMTTSANILIAVHLILAFLILANPISQGLEEILNVPQGNILLLLNPPVKNGNHILISYNQINANVGCVLRTILNNNPFVNVILKSWFSVE